LMKLGGIAVMTTPNGAYIGNKLPRFSDHSDPSMFENVQFRPDSDGHIFLLWPDEIAKLADNAGLALEKLNLFTTPLTNGYVKTHYLLRVLPKSIVWVLESAAQKLPRRMQERVMVQIAARFRKR